MGNLTGHLLIATPELADPNFFRTVSLIFHHDEEGAAGVILNRPTETLVAEIFDNLDPDIAFNHYINIGGPVEGPLMALHSSIASAEQEIIPGVFLSLTQENIRQLVQQTTQQFKIFSGYAGWGAGQLEAEIEMGGWLTFPTEVDDVFETPEELWKIACSKVGNDIIFANQAAKASVVDPLSN